MSITAEKVIEEARKYLGYPYRTQGRDRYGVDCGGMLVLVCTALGITDSDLTGYSNSPDGKTFEVLLQRDLEEVAPKEKLELASIIGMDYGDGLQHVAIVTALEPRLTVIHAKRGKGVVEQYLHGYDLRAWTKTFRIKGIEIEK